MADVTWLTRRSPARWHRAKAQTVTLRRWDAHAARARRAHAGTLSLSHTHRRTHTHTHTHTLTDTHTHTHYWHWHWHTDTHTRTVTLTHYTDSLTQWHTTLTHWHLHTHTLPHARAENPPRPPLPLTCLSVLTDMTVWITSERCVTWPANVAAEAHGRELTVQWVWRAIHLSCQLWTEFELAR